jgi:phosphate transporter
MLPVHATSPEQIVFFFHLSRLWRRLLLSSLPHLPVVVAIFLVRSRLTIWIAHHSREVPTRPRRVSVSSTEENLDLEASLASIGRSFPAPVPEGEEPRPRQNVSRSGTRDGESLGRSRSQTVGVRIANRLRSSIASLGSPHGPAPGNGETIWTSKKNFATDTQLLFKRRITNLYVQVSALRSYVELNYSGFRKVLKK